MEKQRKTGISMGFFDILHEVYICKHKVVFIEIPEWKLKAKFARNTLNVFFAHFWSKIAKSDYFIELFTLVSQSLSHILGNNIASVFLKDWQLKFCWKNFIFGPFWGQNVGPGWVKNDSKGYFHTSHLTHNSEVLKSH